SAPASAPPLHDALPIWPTLTAATPLSDTAVTLAWTDAAGETGFRVDRSANGGSTWTTVGAVGAGVTTFTDAGLAESTSYTYRVVIANADGSSPPTSTPP